MPTLWLSPGTQPLQTGMDEVQPARSFPGTNGQEMLNSTHSIFIEVRETQLTQTSILILHQTRQKSIKRFRNYWVECKAKHCTVWATISIAPEAKIKQNKKAYSKVTVLLGNAQTIYLLSLWVGNDTGTGVKILFWLKQAQGQDLKSGLKCIRSFYIYQLKQMEENCNMVPVSSQLYITQTERLEGFWYYYKFYVLLTF